MLTFAVLYKNDFGITIKVEMEDRMNRDVIVGALRIELYRLENKGFLDSEFGEATAVRGGKRKRYFKVTPLGKKVLENVMETRRQYWEAINPIAFELKLI
jgi:DNA-binding PadR family transcriptional regulator